MSSLIIIDSLLGIHISSGCLQLFFLVQYMQIQRVAHSPTASGRVQTTLITYISQVDEVSDEHFTQGDNGGITVPWHTLDTTIKGCLK